MPVNPNEAPEGFVAVESDNGSCIGCEFQFDIPSECDDMYCRSSEREDRMMVIFVPRTEKPATANFPHDDMGTPV